MCIPGIDKKLACEVAGHCCWTKEKRSEKRSKIAVEIDQLTE